MKMLLRFIYELLVLAIVFTAFLINIPIIALLKSKITPQYLRAFLLKLNRHLGTSVYKLDKGQVSKMHRLELFELAFRNMLFKKARTTITVGGMAISVAAIVFLISLGYGLQHLVVDQVIGLDEMRQLDVMSPVGSDLPLDYSSIQYFSSLPNVDMVFPVLGLVSKVAYNNYSTEVAVYGVTTDYLKSSAMRPIHGSFFESNELTLNNIPNETISTSATLSLPFSTLREAVANEAFLKELNINRDVAVGKKFYLSYTVVNDLADLDSKNITIRSEAVPYTLVGVVQGNETPLLYVPLSDMRGLSITHFSQIRLLADSSENLDAIRQIVSSRGYLTTSVVDTVTQINNLFSILRIGAAIIGGLALIVSSLGMFNTITVSLLERTREVGLMKSLGMTSSEVCGMFLTESSLLGFFGGLFGLVLGYVAGKFLMLLLSVIGLAKGLGYIDITYIPFNVVVIVLISSLILGFITGIYPAYRATKISELDALRYE